MKKQNRGFTIVELVIVIAVIAVLAAVLIPTFSSLIKKANLSADKAAVREMNVALAADEKLKGKPVDLESCMQVLANAGYNSENWVALTKGYEVYWYQEKNIMILYNASTAEVEYPDEYKETWTEGSRTVNIISAQKDRDGKVKHTQVYNGNVKKALEMDTKFDADSVTGGKSITEMTSESGAGQGGTLSSEGTALQNVSDELSSNQALKDALGLTSNNIIVNYSKEITSKTASEEKTYAAVQILNVSDTALDITSQAGDGVSVGNLFYVQIVQDASATESEIKTARKEASDKVYGLFNQMNTGAVSSSSSILLQGGTVLDSSEHEWTPVKSFAGYFGTKDAANPIVITGARLTSATSYSGTIQFDGSEGKYFVTGFFGTVYGNTTIENIRFEKLTIQNPAHDYDMKTSNKAVSRNTVGVIGGVIDNPNDDSQSASNVTLRNIVVDSSVSIIGDANAGGLVGYIGGSGNLRANYNGTLLIDNCHISAKIEGQLNLETDAKYASYGAYGSVGGLIGFSCRCQETSNNTDGDSAASEVYTIVIKDTTFDGSVDGYEDLGAAVGNIQNGAFIFQGLNDFSKAKINEKNLSYTSRCYLGKLCGRINGTSAFIFDTTPACNETDYPDMAYYNYGPAKGQVATLNANGVVGSGSKSGDVKELWSLDFVSNKYNKVMSVDGITALSGNNGDNK